MNYLSARKSVIKDAKNSLNSSHHHHLHSQTDMNSTVFNLFDRIIEYGKIPNEKREFLANMFIGKNLYEHIDKILIDMIIVNSELKKSKEGEIILLPNKNDKTIDIQHSINEEETENIISIEQSNSNRTNRKNSIMSLIYKKHNKFTFCSDNSKDNKLSDEEKDFLQKMTVSPFIYSKDDYMIILLNGELIFTNYDDIMNHKLIYQAYENEFQKSINKKRLSFSNETNIINIVKNENENVKQRPKRNELNLLTNNIADSKSNRSIENLSITSISKSIKNQKTYNKSYSLNGLKKLDLNLDRINYQEAKDIYRSSMLVNCDKLNSETIKPNFVKEKLIEAIREKENTKIIKPYENYPEFELKNELLIPKLNFGFSSVESCYLKINMNLLKSILLYGEAKKKFKVLENHLRKISLAKFYKKSLENISNRFIYEEINANQYIFKEGEEVNYVYFIISGCIELRSTKYFLLDPNNKVDDISIEKEKINELENNITEENIGEEFLINNIFSKVNSSSSITYRNSSILNRGSSISIMEKRNEDLKLQLNNKDNGKNKIKKIKVEMNTKRSKHSNDSNKSKKLNEKSKNKESEVKDKEFSNKIMFNEQLLKIYKKLDRYQQQSLAFDLIKLDIIENKSKFKSFEIEKLDIREKELLKDYQKHNKNEEIKVLLISNDSWLNDNVALNNKEIKTTKFSAFTNKKTDVFKIDIHNFMKYVLIFNDDITNYFIESAKNKERKFNHLKEMIQKESLDTFLSRMYRKEEISFSNLHLMNLSFKENLKSMFDRKTIEEYKIRKNFSSKNQLLKTKNNNEKFKSDIKLDNHESLKKIKDHEVNEVEDKIVNINNSIYNIGNDNDFNKEYENYDYEHKRKTVVKSNEKIMNENLKKSSAINIKDNLSPNNKNINLEHISILKNETQKENIYNYESNSIKSNSLSDINSLENESQFLIENLHKSKKKKLKRRSKIFRKYDQKISLDNLLSNKKIEEIDLEKNNEIRQKIEKEKEIMRNNSRKINLMKMKLESGKTYMSIKIRRKNRNNDFSKDTIKSFNKIRDLKEIGKLENKMNSSKMSILNKTLIQSFKFNNITSNDNNDVDISPKLKNKSFRFGSTQLKNLSHINLLNSNDNTNNLDNSYLKSIKKEDITNTNCIEDERNSYSKVSIDNNNYENESMELEIKRKNIFSTESLINNLSSNDKLKELKEIFSINMEKKRENVSIRKYKKYNSLINQMKSNKMMNLSKSKIVVEPFVPSDVKKEEEIIVNPKLTRISLKNLFKKNREINFDKIDKKLKSSINYLMANTGFSNARFYKKFVTKALINDIVKKYGKRKNKDEADVDVEIGKDLKDLDVVEKNKKISNKENIKNIKLEKNTPSFPFIKEKLSKNENLIDKAKSNIIEFKSNILKKKMHGENNCDKILESNLLEKTIKNNNNIQFIDNENSSILIQSQIDISNNINNNHSQIHQSQYHNHNRNPIIKNEFNFNENINHNNSNLNCNINNKINNETDIASGNTETNKNLDSVKNSVLYRSSNFDLGSYSNINSKSNNFPFSNLKDENKVDRFKSIEKKTYTKEESDKFIKDLFSKKNSIDIFTNKKKERTFLLPTGASYANKGKYTRVKMKMNLEDNR